MVIDIDNILYSSPDFPSGKDINRPKRPPIQEAPIGQKRYRYAVLPELFAKIRFNFGFCPLSASGLTLKNPLIQRILKVVCDGRCPVRQMIASDLLRDILKCLRLRAQVEGLGRGKSPSWGRPAPFAPRSLFSAGREIPGQAGNDG